MGWLRFDPRFALIPAAAALAAIAMAGARGPFWANADPSYPYLFNSLLILSGSAPRLVEHPGTPVEVAGAVVVGLSTPLHSTQSRVRTVLRDPERFLRILYTTVLLSYCLTLAVLGQVASRVLRSVRAGLITQATPFLSFHFLWALASYQPEPALLILTAVLSIIVLLWLHRAESLGDRDGFAILLGMTVALAVATKITALPLMAIPPILYGRSRAVFRFLAAFAVTFLAALAPMLPGAGRALSWYASILTHTGKYGEGSAGVIQVRDYLFALGALVWLDLVCFGLLAGTAAFLVLDRPRTEGGRANLTPRNRVVVGILVVQVVQLLIVAKHPDNHYLIPATSLAALAFALTWTAAESRFGMTPAISNSALLVLAGGISVFRMAGPGHLAPWGDYAYHLRTARRSQDRVRALNADQAARPNTILVQFYGSSTPALALKLGNLTSGDLLAPQICALHGPQAIFYNLWTREYDTLCGPLTAADVVQRANSGVEIRFRGLRLAGIYDAMRPTEFNLQPESEGRLPTEEVVYRAVVRAGNAPALATSP